jgi:hypothetical protein
MGGKNMGYVTGPLQIAAGAGATALGAPEIGIPLITGGVGQTAGTAAGGQKGGMLGELAGGAAGGLGEGGAGLMGMGPLSSSLGGTGAGQGLQGLLGMGPKPGELGSSMAAGATPATGAAAFPAPGAKPLAGAFPAPGGPPTIGGLASQADPYLTAMQGAGMPQGTAGLTAYQQLQQGYNDQLAGVGPISPTTPATPAAAATPPKSTLDKIADSPITKLAGPVSNLVGGGGGGGQQQQQPPQPPPRRPPPPPAQAPASIAAPTVPTVPQSNFRGGPAPGAFSAGGAGQMSPQQQMQARMLQQMLGGRNLGGMA